MPGQKITPKQIGLYMTHRKDGYIQAVAAAKSGFSERSARNLENRGYRPAEGQRHWRTRKDPYEGIWDTEVVPMLEEKPKLQARAVLDHLQEKFPGKYPDTKLRTLERRVAEWKAKYGPEKEIIFRQNHPPGWQALSDFTPANSLRVTINGEPLEHNLYHFRLAYSGWEYASVILGGESFSALAEGLQNALWQCGGVPETHRTDSLSAAFKNLSKDEREDQTKRYEELCTFYGMEATRNNRGVSHENGSVESSHRHLKNSIDQALMIRGNRDFRTLDEYRLFVRGMTERRNRRIQKLYLEELAHLGSLPEGKTTDYTEERARVTNSSTIRVKSVIYSVPARLIGMTLRVHLYDDRLECFIGGDSVLILSRKRKRDKCTKRIDYRHLIGQLCRKPGAFMNYVFQDACFPSLSFRQTWERLQSEHDRRQACREYVGILKVAAEKDREEAVSRFLERRLEAGSCPTSEEVQALFQEPRVSLPKLCDICDDLGSYDHLLSGGAS